jgi:dCMP deaminase
MSARLDWDDYFLRIAHETAARSTCPRRHVGAVLVREKRIVATGYNGSPAGHPHCTDEGCYLVFEHCKRTVHAELNALLYAGDAKGATIYCTDRPCLGCANAIATAGVVEVVYDREYATDAPEVWRVLTLSGVTLRQRTAHETVHDPAQTHE